MVLLLFRWFYVGSDGFLLLRWFYVVKMVFCCGLDGFVVVQMVLCWFRWFCCCSDGFMFFRWFYVVQMVLPLFPQTVFVARNVVGLAINDATYLTLTRKFEVDNNDDDDCHNVKELLRVGLHWRVTFIEDLLDTVQVVW